VGREDVLYHDALADLVRQVAGQHFLQRPILPPPLAHLEHSEIVELPALVVLLQVPALVVLLQVPALVVLLQVPALVVLLHVPALVVLLQVPALVVLLQVPALVGLDRLLLPQPCLLHR
jgi:hypothetical protein